MYSFLVKMGSNLFKNLNENFWNFSKIFDFLDFFHKQINSDEEDFTNYLENLNHTKSHCYDVDRKISKSKFSKNQNLFNDKMKNREIEKVSTTHSVLTNKLLKKKKIYQNEILEKDSLMQKILNRKINRKMRKFRRDKTVINISTTDTIYT